MQTIREREGEDWLRTWVLWWRHGHGYCWCCFHAVSLATPGGPKPRPVDWRRWRCTARPLCRPAQPPPLALQNTSRVNSLSPSSTTSPYPAKHQHRVNSLSPSSTHSPCPVTTSTELTLQSQFYQHTLAFNHQHRVNSLPPALPTLPAFNHQHRINSLSPGSTNTTSL